MYALGRNMELRVTEHDTRQICVSAAAQKLQNKNGSAEMRIKV